MIFIKYSEGKASNRLIKLAAITICLLVYSSLAFATHTTITSLPYTTTKSGTASVYDTLFLSGTKLSSATNGIYIEHNYIVLNLGSDTLAFGTNTSNNNVGVRIGYLKHDIIIKGGWIIYDPDSIPWNDAWVNSADLDSDYPPTNNNNKCMYSYGNSYNILIDSVSMITGGWNGKIIVWPSGYNIYQWEVSGGDYWNNCTGYYDRCGGSAVSFDLPSTNTTGDYCVKIHNITLHNSPYGGMRVYRVAQVYACSLNLDIQNVLYNYQTDSYCKGSANADAIGLQYARPGATIHDNIITASQEHNGGRGIQIEGPNWGTADSMITIYNNYVVSYQGNDAYYPLIKGAAFKYRNPIEYMHVYDNTFISYSKGEPCVSDDCRNADTITWADGRSEGFYNSLSTISDFSGVAPYAPANCLFENNNIICLALDADAEAMGMSFEKLGTGDTITSNIWRYNKIQCNSEGIRFGEYNGKASNLTMYGDTIVGIDSSYRSDFHTIYFYSSDCKNIVLQDMVFQGLAEDKDVTYKSGVSGCDVAFERTLKVLVLDSLYNKYPGAIVKVTNNYGVIEGYDTSGVDGMAGVMCRYHRDFSDRADSTGYNPFDIIIYHGSDTVSVANLAVSDSIYMDTVRLIHSVGDPDTVSPSTIDDLNAIPGEDDGEIILSWTAPGDDGNIGVADHYEIRYSQSLITESNWENAIECSSPPSPASPGETETYTISGLEISEIYYIAIKTYDNVYSESDLSNIAESYANGIIAPVPLSTEVDSSANSVTVTADIVDSYQSLYYIFELDSLSTYPEPEFNLDLSADTMASVTFSNLSSDVVYYWRVCAVAANGSDTSDWSSSVEFNLITGIAAELAESDCIYPSSGATVLSNLPILEVNSLPDISYYYFQLDDNSEFASPIESGPVLKSSGMTTSWQVTEPLTGGQTYYWRASSNGTIYTSPIAFSAILDIHPYPNPFRASESAYITFTNLEANSEITIATISGNIIYQNSNIGPNNWEWDVKNDNGQELAPGVYLYNINYSNGSSSGKIVIINN